MKKTNLILLPGLDKQIKFLFERINVENLNSLVLGSQSVQIAKWLSEKSKNEVNLIVEDYESLMNSEFELGNSPKVNLKLMDFERTDFFSEQFDLIYAQASISNFRRKNIIKELKHITKRNGILCLGEIVKLKREVPVFVKDIFNSADLDPLSIEDLGKYYTERSFDIVDSSDLSESLKDFYINYAELLKAKSKLLSNSEKSYHKKLLNQINHQSNAYLKLGADKFIGFKTLLLKKNNL